MALFLTFGEVIRALPADGNTLGGFARDTTTISRLSGPRIVERRNDTLGL
jgi:hypothetical protein